MIDLDQVDDGWIAEKLTQAVMAHNLFGLESAPLEPWRVFDFKVVQLHAARPESDPSDRYLDPQPVRQGAIQNGNPDQPKEYENGQDEEDRDFPTISLHMSSFFQH